MNAPELRATAAAAAATTTAAEPSDLDRLLRQPAFSTRDLLVDNTLDKVLRLAEVMASGRVTCPKHLQGNVGDCAAVIGQAMRWGFDHNSVAQKTHLVNGVLGYESQLIVAALNASPLLATRINWQWADGWDGTGGKDDKSAQHWVEVSACLRGESSPRVLRVSMAQVGSVRNSPNWVTDARQQLAYLAAKRWGRLHAPDVILGVYSGDELQAGGEDFNTGLGASTAGAEPTPHARPALPAYDPEKFEKNLPGWKKLIDPDAGKTASALLAMLSTKATFTEEQKARILSLKKAEPEAQVDKPDDDFVAQYDAASEGAK